MDENNISELVPAVDGTDDREARSKFWIAAYTRPRSEKAAAAQLAKNPHCPILTFVATQTQIKEWSDRKKKVESVVIPMVIFAEVSSEEEILEIKKHHLIRKILTFPGKKEPAHIPTKQIEQLKFMLNKTDEPVEFVEGNFKVYDKVKVVDGKLAGLEGIVIRTADGNTKLVVLIDLLGGASIIINFTNLQLIHD